MDFEVRYNRSERIFHRLAFAGPSVQMVAADIENSTLARQFTGANDRNPVFITSLARAGTTLVLELLSQHPDLASHTYRDMPFVLAPIFWDRFFGRFRREGEARERAHGDGVQIGFDSPESFEEVFWKAHWPDHYRHAQRIPLWKPRHLHTEATAFFRKHMQKIVSLRRPENSAVARYVSKNNANIARIDLLKEMLPDAHILVVLRHPLEHAASLLRQHRNFAMQQAADSFVTRYMADIGHFEFGELHRPFGFPGLSERATPDAHDYWLAYWIAAFQHVEERYEHVQILPYEALCSDPGPVLQQLCLTLDLDPGELSGATDLIRPLTRKTDPGQFSPALVAEAEAIYATLSTRSGYPHAHADQEQTQTDRST